MITLPTAGALLYGARWQAPLARDLGVSREAVRLWCAGVHPVPEAVRLKLEMMLHDRREQIGAALV